MTNIEPEIVARRIIDASRYMVLATADPAGEPWISPVWFAHAAYREFLWISRPGRRHSENIAARPEVAISIFDTRQAVGTGHGVVIAATAVVLDGETLVRATKTVARRSVEHGGGMFTAESFAGDAAVRLYRATAVEQFVVLGDDNRVRVEI